MLGKTKDYDVARGTMQVEPHADPIKNQIICSVNTPRKIETELWLPFFIIIFIKQNSMFSF